MDDRIWKAWLTFTEQARSGAEEMRCQWEAIADGSAGPDAIARWISKWIPREGAAALTDLASELAESVERWWDAVGMVPRARYDEALRQNERLRQRLEETETAIAELRRCMETEAAERTMEEARAVFEQWAAGTRETLDAQAEWTRKWVGGWLSPLEKGKP